jgi:hypothetical protein
MQAAAADLATATQAVDLVEVDLVEDIQEQQTQDQVVVVVQVQVGLV